MHVTVTSLHMCGGRTVPFCMFMSVDQYTEIMNREFCQCWIPIGRGVEFLKFCATRCSCVLYSKQVTTTTPVHLSDVFFSLFYRMEWLQQGSRELFGTIIEDQVCTDVSLR